MGKNSGFTVRFDKVEIELLKERAMEYGMSVNQYIKYISLQSLEDGKAGNKLDREPQQEANKITKDLIFTKRCAESLIRKLLTGKEARELADKIEKEWADCGIKYTKSTDVEEI